MAGAARAAALAGASAAGVAGAAEDTAQAIRKACLSSGPVCFDLFVADAAPVTVYSDRPLDGSFVWEADQATALHDREIDMPTIA